MAAIDAAVCSRRSRPLRIGSIKGQVGHSEASAGLVAVSKILLAMESGIISGTQNVTPDSINPALRGIVEGRMQVVTEHAPLCAPEQCATVAVNNFGVSNLFGHAVLRGNPKAKRVAAKKEPENLVVGAQGEVITLEPMPKVVFVSARNDEAMTKALVKVGTKKLLS